MNDDYTAALRAISQAEEHADDEWKIRYYAAILTCAVAYDTFTTQQVSDIYQRNGDAATHDLRAIGALIRRAVREGMIERTDEWRTTGSHGRPQLVWRSLVHLADFSVGKIDDIYGVSYGGTDDE